MPALRVVLDTNVVLASKTTTNPTSPNRELLELVQALGAPVGIEFFHLPRYPADADDIAFVLCALNGAASHLVTYDQHLFDVAQEYPFVTCKPVQFLAALRAT